MIILIVVDLPAPLGPRRPKISPSRVAKEISSTALTLPKLLLTERNSINEAPSRSTDLPGSPEGGPRPTDGRSPGALLYPRVR